MRSSKTWCWALVGLALSATTALADGYRGSVKDAAQPFSWTGFYIGGHAGLVTGETTGDLGLPAGLLNTDYSLNGALYGAQIGYNLQYGGTVFGIEASWSGADIQGNTACVVLLECRRNIDSIATVVGRLGLAVDRSLLYVMGGVAWADVDTSVSIVGFPIASASETHVGWVAGLGFEYAFSNRISTRVEYSHIDLGSETHNLTVVGGVIPPIPDKVDVRVDTIRLGVNIKLTN